MSDDNIPFVALPPFRERRDHLEREPEDQRWMIREIRTWLENNLWREGLSVAFDHDWAPDEHVPEQPSIFSGRKMKSRSGETCNGAVDVLVRDDNGMSVPLIIEVEPSLSPKCIFGDVGAIVSSDRHVPSGKYSEFSEKSTTDYFLRDTLLAVLTFNQPEATIKRLAEECRRTFSIPNGRIREFRICSGKTREEAVTNCKRFLKLNFPH